MRPVAMGQVVHVRLISNDVSLPLQSMNRVAHHSDHGAQVAYAQLNPKLVATTSACSALNTADRYSLFALNTRTEAPLIV